MVDAFLYSQHNAVPAIEEAKMKRLVTIGLLQCYLSMLKALPEHMQNFVQLQVGLNSILFHSIDISDRLSGSARVGHRLGWRVIA